MNHPVWVHCPPTPAGEWRSRLFSDFELGRRNYWSFDGAAVSNLRASEFVIESVGVVGKGNIFNEDYWLVDLRS